jgi:hypothetical protein
VRIAKSLLRLPVQYPEALLIDTSIFALDIPALISAGIT